MSDTTIFLSNHTKIFDQYEPMLRRLRHRLEQNRSDLEIHREIRGELVALRKNLRHQGYNLRLGSIELKLEGFRNDDSLGEGFLRCVIAIMEDHSVYYVTGTSNHIELDERLETIISTGRAAGKNQLSRHFLWFRWINRVLVLSGAATETKDNFDDLREYTAEHKDSLLKSLAKIG
jgi:hypothetical protein